MAGTVVRVGWLNQRKLCGGMIFEWQREIVGRENNTRKRIGKLGRVQSSLRLSGVRGNRACAVGLEPEFPQGHKALWLRTHHSC